MPLLEVSDLVVRYGEVEALRGVSFSLDRGESLAVVGESAAGKSTLALCLAGLIQPPEASGSVRLAGHELIGATAESLRSLRWSTVAIGLQGAPFNPVVTVGAQVAEPLREHWGVSAAEARRRADALAPEVRLDPAALDRYPHQLSGGERRRATLAMVLALDPDLVVLDEPTAGLDLATKAELVERVGKLAVERGFALLVISHDLPDASRLATRSLVLYAGEVVEAGATSQVLGTPAHPYSSALIGAYPLMSTAKDLRPIRGAPPDPTALPGGCSYHPRCSQAEEICVSDRPVLSESRGRQVACHFGGLKTLLRARDLRKSFSSAGGWVHALAGVSLAVREGESLGIVGPSGSGKSTLARILSGYLAADEGEVLLEGDALTTSWRAKNRQRRRRVQLVMQDPTEALSPRLTVEELVREALDLSGTGSRDEHRLALTHGLASVGLPTSAPFLAARSHQLSGGQLQRLALARALLAEPKLLVADEPTAMLDASEQARLLVVLRERQVEMGLGLVLVSHDLAVVRKVADRIIVLEAGRVVEEGPAHQVCAAPRSLTARRLLETAPSLSICDPAGDEALFGTDPSNHERRQT